MGKPCTAPVAIRTQLKSRYSWRKPVEADFRNANASRWARCHFLTNPRAALFHGNTPANGVKIKE